MENLFKKSIHRINTIDVSFKRFLHNEISWEYRLIGIKGARGTGKTTLILQYIKQNLEFTNETLFVSLDKFYFTENKLTDLADEFVKNGGKYLFLDEVHKYPTWSQEIKNIYDDFPDLKIVFTGSSVLEIIKADADLSRRAIIYNLPELSLREYLELMYSIKLPIFSLTQICENHLEICNTINNEILPVRKFKEYNKQGAYPFIKETGAYFLQQLETVINLIIEVDLPLHVKIEYSTINKLKKLLFVLSESVPFQPNISKLSDKLNTSRDNLLKYLDLLQKAELIKLLRSNTIGVSYLSKPQKIYFNNNSLMYAVSKDSINIGTIRETFFLNQLSVKHSVTYPPIGDFLIDNKYTFEIGGKNKTRKQIIGIENAYIAADDIEIGFQNKIPIWLFGFLY